MIYNCVKMLVADKEMHVNGSRKYAWPAAVPKMPLGLEHLLEGLTKEVIKNNPTNIYEFCANHMLHLLEIRKGSEVKRSLSLEEKVTKAQERVRQRAKKRWQRYDDQLIQLNEINCATDLKSKEDDRIIETYQVMSQVDSAIHNYPGLGECFQMKKIISECDQVRINKNENDLATEILKKNLQFSEVKKLNENINVESSSEVEEITEIDMNDDQIIEGTSEINVGDNLKTTVLTSKEEQVVSQGCFNEFQEIKLPKSKQHYQGENIEITTELESYPGGDKKVHLQESNIELKDKDLNFIDSDISNICINNNNVIKKNITLPDDDKKTDFNSITISSPFVVDEKCHIQPISADCVNTTTNDNIETEIVEENTHKLRHTDLTLNHMVKIDNNFKISVKKETGNDNSQELSVEGNKSKLMECELSEKNLNKHDDILEVSQYSITDKNNDNGSHIYESGKMNLETAAITIQKVFRNFLFKRRHSTFDEETNDNSNTSEETSDTKDVIEYSMICAYVSKDRRPLGNTKMDTVLQTVNEEKSLSQSTDDSSTLSSAATIIQAHVRGFLVRNKLNSSKTSSNSLVNANGRSSRSRENDQDLHKSKTPLNIHIIPEANHFSSRDESIIVSMDLSLDGSPLSSLNLHPLGYAKSERRKLKREDAVQSFSPPINSSGKLSEDVDSVKEILKAVDPNFVAGNCKAKDLGLDYIETEVSEILLRENTPDGLYSESNNDNESISSQLNTVINNESGKDSLTMSSDETDVITPFSTTPASTPLLSHTGEFHDVVLPTKVSRGDTSVVRGE